MPWNAILTSKPVWALVIGEIGHDWALYTMVSDLPKYMSDVMKFNPAEVNIICLCISMFHEYFFMIFQLK